MTGDDVRSCCYYPHGKSISIVTFVMAILAELVGALSGFGAGQVFGLIAMILLIVSSCKKYSRCGLVTTAIMALLAALFQLGTGSGTMAG